MGPPRRKSWAPPVAVAPPTAQRAHRVPQCFARLAGLLPGYRCVPLMPETTALLRDYLAVHPRRDEPTAPLWPGMALTRPRYTGVRTPPADTGAATGDGAAATPSASAKARARRQAEALSELTVAEAEERLVLDWTQPLRHATFYKAIYRPAVLRPICAPLRRATRPQPYRRNSSSTRSATLTRVCASRRGSSPRSSAGGWGTPTYGRRWTCTCTCSPTTTRRTTWPLWAHCPHRSRRTAEMLCRYTVLRTSL